MRIIGIAGVLPSRRVTNQEITELVGQYSKNDFEGDLPGTLKLIGKLLQKSGIESRHWLAPGERPMDLMRDAFEKALAQAGIQKKDIDLLIYASVSRGFIEPANSTFVAHALGLDCTNYDVINACMGWVSSMDMVNDKMKAGAIRHAVIVNMEFGQLDSPVFSENAYALKSPSELAYRFPALTLGSVATVTILGNESPDNFKFSFKNLPALGKLCTVSLPGWEYFCNEADVAYIAPTGGKFQFNSHGQELHDAMVEVPRIYETHAQRHGIAKSDIHRVFTHTSSPKRWRESCQAIGIADKLHAIGHQTGNVVTASAPLGIADAMEQGNLKKSQFCMGLIGSAGMVFSAMSFNL
jgi:3-oxoacyl-[acyl-carrier-protein] synthase III